MTRLSTYLIGAAAVFVAACLCFYYFAVKPQTMEELNPLLGFSLPIFLVIASFVMLTYTTHYNFYNVRVGQVIAHGSSNLVQLVSITGAALCIRDVNGHEGWLHFTTDMRETYPVGSYYPKSN